MRVLTTRPTGEGTAGTLYAGASRGPAGKCSENFANVETLAHLVGSLLVANTRILHLLES